MASSRQELISKMEKIKTPEEAIAYLYASYCHLLPSFGEQHQFVNKTDNGYEVVIMYYNFFGCGNHATMRQKYLVKEDGDIKLVESAKLEAGEDFCGD